MKRRLGWSGARQHEVLELRRSEEEMEERVARHGGRGQMQKGGRGPDGTWPGGPSDARSWQELGLACCPCVHVLLSS